jgi:hypothetical protein
VVGAGDAKTIRWTKYMITIDAIILHVLTTVLTFSSNSDVSTATFVRGFNIYKMVQVMGFW